MMLALPDDLPMECAICDCKYLKENSRKYREVKCLYCAFSVCNTCCEKYILSQATEAHCMFPSCKKRWPRKFIANSFSNKFLNTVYKEHRENFLLDLEKAKLPECQIHVERIIREESLCAERAAKLQLMKEMKADLENTNTELYRLRRTINEGDPLAPTATGYTFMHQCPDEDCRGYVSTQWKCGLCNKFSCPQCHEIKGLKNAAGEFDNEHVCNEDVKLTVALMAKDTKQCPKCQTQIYKIDGCDQMWCTICHTAFSWNTGLVETRIHNPHWYEWMRKQSADGEIPREPGDIVCGGGGGIPARELTHQTGTIIAGLFNRRHSSSRTDSALAATVCSKEYYDIMKYSKEQLVEFVRDFLHFKYVSINDYLRADNPRSDERENLYLRTSFMRGRISERDFKLELQKKDKYRQKKRELRDVYEMFVNATTDIVYRFIDYLTKCELGQVKFEFLDELANLVVYANDNVADIGAVYKCKPILFPRRAFYLPTTTTTTPLCTAVTANP